MPLHLGQELLSRAATLLASEAARMTNSQRPAQKEAPLDGADVLAAVREVFSHPAAERGPLRSRYETSQVPLISCDALVQGGTEAVAALRIVNEEDVAADISLYTTNFVSDSGYEIASLAARVSPRNAHVAAGGEVTFEVRIAVPSQAPAGMYSGLVQATNSRYVKAVIAFDVT